MKQSLFSLLIFIGLLQSACSSISSHTPDEGYIVYSIEYLNADSLDGMKAMLPDEMTLYFKNNSTCSELVIGAGLFETRMISNSDNFTMNTLVKALGQKSVMKLRKDDVDKNYQDRVPLELTYTNKRKEIAGYNCKEILVRDSTGNEYKVYFTEDIHINEPNWSTPFRDVKGIMLDYSLNFNGMIMHLTAKEVKFEAVDSTYFNLPEDYKEIKKEKLKS